MQLFLAIAQPVQIPSTACRTSVFKRTIPVKNKLAGLNFTVNKPSEDTTVEADDIQLNLFCFFQV